MRKSPINRNRSRARHTSAFAASIVFGALPVALAAQGGISAPMQRPTFAIAPTFQSWSLAKDVPLDSLLISGASQISAPFAISIPFRARWSASITGAVASSKLTARDSAGSVTRSFSGLSDVRVRASGPLIGEALQLTVGVNVPTGAVNLSPVQNDVIRVTAAPALDAQVPIAGTGFGGTIGLIYAHTIGEWAWAFGASAEQRGTYAPLDAQIAGVKARTELDPGAAAHFSVGADGLVGQNRLSLGVVTDVYGSDQLRVTSAGNHDITQQYKLSPTISVAAALEVKNATFRDLVVRASERYRMGFADAKGVSIDGSSGNYFDAGISGYLGAPNRTSVLLGLSARQQTGLPVDKGFIGAGVTSVGGTLGLAIPTSTLVWRPTVQAWVGSLKTQLVTTGITGITASVTVSRP